MASLMEEMIPFLSLDYQLAGVRTDIQEAIMRVYDRNWFVLGEELKSFEEEFAAFTGVPFCIGVGNGLDALTLALKACSLSKEDDVIVPAHTYIATWLAISRTGARIVPVEPDIHTFNLDVTKVEEAITPRTKVILPVHLYGQACDMTTLDEIARKYHLLIVEDNAQAQGSKWLKKSTGSYGVINATSFYPTKNLGALGDAGGITTFDAAKAEFVTRYRNYGLEQKNIGLYKGVNTRLDEIQAAALRVKLRYLNEWNEARRQVADEYLMRLQGVGDITLPLSDKEAYHVYHLFVIRTQFRDALAAYLHAQGIGTRVHYPVPPHLQKAYYDQGYGKGDFPITEQMAETILSLPLWPGMRKDQIAYICETVERFFSKRPSRDSG